jgi:hypothetical protein
MMVKPPGYFWRWRVFEIDNRVLVARELVLVKERACAVDESPISELDIVANALRVKAREKSGRCSAVKTFVMKKNPDFQESSWL